MLITSPIVNENMSDGGGASMEGFGAAPAGAAGAAGGEFGGVDPNMDPELAMALRVSMEEERARQESEAPPAPEPLSTVPEALDAAPAVAAPTDAAPAATPVAAPAAADAASGGDEMDDDALLQQALALSMNDNAEGAGKLDDEVRTGNLISPQAQTVGSDQRAIITSIFLFLICSLSDAASPIDVHGA
jgi:26S proteasome regulatory subunit N10